MTDRSCRVLLIYPKFVPNSFWNYAESCKLVDARYPAAPLGLITVAALLPQSWEFKLVNCNTEELDPVDIDWADMVMTGGMMNQQPDCLRLISLCHAHDKPVVVGGPDATSSPHLYTSADFQVLGEAEDVIKNFVSAWERGERSGIFAAEKFQVDVTKTPIPRFDLLTLEHYLYICVQYSRGCPFTCEFCDIIELYGRNPRTKANEQMLAELDRLYVLGYRGHVDFVDDNLIGNKKALKKFLPKLKAWQETHDYPFEFSTEASINLADDDQLLEMMKQANFFAVFIGIESPDPETLIQMRKKQNTKRNIAECVHKIYGYGMFVTAGFIVGFDSEKALMADSMVAFIDECAIPVCMVGLLYALPNTQLTRRLAKEGRLYEGHDMMREDRAGDQCSLGINFVPKRPLREVLTDYKRILRQVYDPAAYASRLDRLASMLNRSDRRRALPEGDMRRRMGSLETVYHIINAVPDAREVFWNTFTNCARTNPAALRYIVLLMAIYIYLGPFSRTVIAEIDRRIAAIDEAEQTLIASGGGVIERPRAAGAPLH
jgi:radical SAM superfamily enzyme YgiQ (UPF0313 family)